MECLFGISGFELVLILVFVLIVFGPDKLPELGRTIGRAMSTFKRAQEDMERVIRAEMYTSDKKPTASAAATATGAVVPGAATADQPKPVSQAEDIWAATDEADDEDEEDEE